MGAIRGSGGEDRGAAGGDAWDPSADARVDPLFAVPFFCSELRLPRSACTHATADWLTHAVARTPRDLVAHVLRIHLLQDLGDRTRLADALADLWIELGASGRQLRERMLHAVAPDLPAGAADCFVEGAALGDGHLPWGGCPVLARGCAQRPLVIRRS